MQIHKLVLIAIAALVHSATAATAPWYLWQFRIDNVMTAKTTCAQTATGTWMQISGPFEDAACTVPISK